MNQASNGKSPLAEVKVLILTSGHEVTDHRIYHKQAQTLSRLGATVTIVGKVARTQPADVNILPIRVVSSRILRFLWVPWVCMWRARNHQADIIHVHDAEMLLIAVPAKLWWRGSKFVYDVHEDFPSLLLIRDWLPVFLRPILKVAVDIIEKNLASFADAIVGVTAPLAKKFNNPMKVAIYNFPSRRLFDCAREVHVKPKNRKYDLVHLGTLSNQRALFLAETIRTLHDMRPNSRSLVIGLTPEVRRLIESRVPDSCVLMDKIGHEMIPEILSDCKVGINVHPWLGPHLKVALPVKVCEYMACGCAVVSSTLPVLDEILNAETIPMQEPLVTILDSKVPVDYVRAVLRFVEAIEKGDDPGMRLRAFALSHMNWETEADKLCAFYLHLLGRPCPT